MSLSVKTHIRFERGRGSRRELREGDAPTPPLPGRVPRVARLMALAIRMERLITEGHVDDYAALARLGRVTRARLSQIMDLLLLPPDLIEEILHLPLVERGRDPITERDLRAIVRETAWERQREMWTALASDRLYR